MDQIVNQTLVWYRGRNGVTITFLSGIWHQAGRYFAKLYDEHVRVEWDGLSWVRME